MVFPLLYVLFKLVKRSFNFDKFMVILLLSIFTFQPNIVKIMFQLINCRKLAQNPRIEPDKSFLEVNMLISCNDEEYHSWMLSLLLPGFMIFALLAPLLTNLYLIKVKDSVPKHEVLNKFGFRLLNFGLDKFYWYLNFS